MTRIKICGLMQINDIEAVNTEKPDYIGFIFANSRRAITPSQAFDLRNALSPNIIPVGVFVDEPIQNIISLVQHGVINAIQLHGSENEQYIQKLKSITNKPIIKAIPIQNKGDVQKWEQSCADHLLLDNINGGTGQTFNWNLIGQTNTLFFLAGGLTTANVTEAIKKTTPFAVDVSSSVETNGAKDPAKIKNFIRRVRDEQ